MSPWPLQALSSVGAWEASTSGTDWVSSVSGQTPYSTPMAVTDRVDAQGQVTGTQLSGDANLGDFMWHPAVNGQPARHYLSLDRAAGLTTRDDPWGDGVGLNTLLIQAQDGGAATPFRRGLSWVFVDGYNIGDVVGNEVVGLYGRSVALVAPGQIPEPAGAVLVGLALVGLVATRKGRPLSQGS